MTTIDYDINIPDTSADKVAHQLAVIAGFPEGSEVAPARNTLRPDLGPHCWGAYHKKTIDGFVQHSPIPEPDIAVIQVCERVAGESFPKPTNEYRIVINNKSDPKVITRIDAKIRKTYGLK